MQKFKKLLKALLCLLKPKQDEITLEKFNELETKKPIKKPNYERGYYEP